MSSTLRIAVISDLHCLHSTSEKNEVTSSFLHSDKLRNPVNKHPISAFLKEISEENLEADILICPGDITHKIDKQGLITGVSFLTEIKKGLKCKETVISIGNHDIDTFRIHSDVEDALAITKNFKENFPYDDKNYNKEFWSQGFSLTQFEGYNVLNINSCHNLLSDKDSKRIIIPLQRIDEIVKAVKEKGIQENEVNIVVLHHHPIKHSNTDEIEYRDGDVLSNGDKLIRKLKSIGFDFIIHGHKHRARISEVDSVSVFCSGSFSCTQNVTEHSYSNFFHIIEISKREYRTSGKIFTWDYSVDNGWSKSADVKKFPHITGFGCSIDLPVLIDQVRNIFESQQVRTVPFSKLLEKHPHFENLNSEKQTQLYQTLQNKDSIIFHPDIFQGPKNIIKHD